MKNPFLQGNLARKYKQVKEIKTDQLSLKRMWQEHWGARGPCGSGVRALSVNACSISEGHLQSFSKI